MVSTLLVTVGPFVDGCVIGIYLGTDSMAAFGYALPFVLIILTGLGVAVSNGSGATGAVYMGLGNREMTNANFSAACLLSVIFGLGITLLCFPLSRQIAGMLGAKGNILPLSDDFIRAISFGAFPMIFAQTLMRYLRLDNDAILNVVGAALLTATNIALDILFVSGLNLGMFGIGLATSLSYTMAMMVCLLHFFRRQNTLSLGKSKSIPSEMKNIIVIGTSSLLNGICLSLRGLFLNNLLFLLGGVAAVSALSVQNNVNQFLMPVLMGTGITLSMMTGIFYGEGDAGAMERVLRVSMKSGITACAFISLALFALAPYIAGFILGKGSDAGIAAVKALRYFSFSLPLSMICVNFLDYYQTIKNLFLANAICIAHGLLGPVLAAFLFSKVLGADGVWLAFSTGEAFTLFCLMVLLKLKNGKWPITVGDFLMLPTGFEGEDRHVLDLSLRNDMSDVVELSRRISEFCGQYSQDGKKIRRLSLCIEEMAGNIVEHGFKRPGERFIDIRIIIEEGKFIFRVRDNGVAFNPLKYADMENALGIRLVSGIAKSIDYRNTIGINNLMITL